MLKPSLCYLIWGVRGAGRCRIKETRHDFVYATFSFYSCVCLISVLLVVKGKVYVEGL